MFILYELKIIDHTSMSVNYKQYHIPIDLQAMQGMHRQIQEIYARQQVLAIFEVNKKIDPL